MKQLIVIRHAKSSWKDARLDDHDRTLNKRGERDAPFMATEFKKLKLEPVYLISSTATRALETAKYFATALGYKKRDIVRDNRLYLASPEELLDVVRQLPDEKNTVLLFGHNPGITSFVNDLTAAGIQNVPTCGMCAISFTVSQWSEVRAGTGELIFFQYPKLFFNDSED